MVKKLMLSAKYEGRSIETFSFAASQNSSEETTDKIVNTSFSGNKPITTAKFCLNLNVTQASCFRSELNRSEKYAKSVFKHFTRICKGEPDVITVTILLKPTHRNPIDYRFGKEIQTLVNESIELEHFMSMLSTLGGAFSSLGDQFVDFAKMAGKISVQQYKIALKLGDPFIIMRCQLYFSISLIQCLKLKAAKHVIQHVYQAMKRYPKDKQDQRILCMCLGIWAKLKYVWQTSEKWLSNDKCNF